MRIKSLVHAPISFAATMACCFIITVACMNNLNLSQGGSGTEIGNPTVTGMVVDAQGSPAGNVQVTVRPAGFDPVTDGPTPDSDMVTTGADGIYSFSVAKNNIYTIEAVHRSRRTRALLADVAVGEVENRAPRCTLNVPGVIKVMVPGYADTAHGFMFIPGTSIFTMVKFSRGFVLLDSVPVGLVPKIVYSSTSGATATTLRYNVTVTAGDTAIVGNPGWNYSRKITLNTSATGANAAGTVTNFPVLIRLTAANFDFTQARNDGEDIRFSKRDNTFLPYEIERWDPVAGLAEVWVRVDTVFGSDSVQSVTMYWGNPNAAGESNGAAVFDTSAGFAGVWHLNRKCDDVTYAQNNGTNYGSSDTTGIIGYCKKFDGSDSIKIAGLLGSPASITMSAWAQLDTVPGGNGGEILSIGDAVLIRMDFSVLNEGTMGAIHPYGDSVYYNVTTGQYLKQTGWHLITFTVDQNNHSQTLYIDGSAVRSENGVISIDYSKVGQNTLIGTHGNGRTGYNFSGGIDEVRVYRKSISADYVKLSFMNQKQDDRLVTIKSLSKVQ